MGSPVWLEAGILALDARGDLGHWSRRGTIRRMKRLGGLILAGALALPGLHRRAGLHPPGRDHPDAWYQAHAQGIAEGSAHVQTWWTVFEDPLLAELIRDAQESNKDLQGAYFRILEARAIRGIAVGDRYPQVDVTAEASTAEPSESATGLTERVDTFAFGAGLAWEIDLFGRIRRGVEAATAQYDASVEDYRDVLVTLLGDVALNYLEVRTLQARLFFARSNIDAQRESLALTQARFDAGLTSALDVAQAESNLGRSEAEVPALEALLEASLNRVEVLTGRPPGALHERLAAVQPIPLPPEEVALGLPAELLRQRPDVRQAERQLAAQTARIGVATADLYPRLSLTGFFASDAGDLGDLATGKSLTWGIGIPLRWNVFSGGKVQNQIKAERARADQAFKRYEQSVLRALEEVQTALAAYTKEKPAGPAAGRGDRRHPAGRGPRPHPVRLGSHQLPERPRHPAHPLPAPAAARRQRRPAGAEPGGPLPGPRRRLGRRGPGRDHARGPPERSGRGAALLHSAQRRRA